MKQMMGTILKLVLVLVGLLLLIGVVLYVVTALELPWWAGVFILLGLAGVAMGLLMVRRMLLRNREKRFVQQVIAQDDAYRSTADSQEQDSLKELQGRWKEAITALRRSHLKRYGNPLYVLPWYMIIGESGSGKTTAIESARLSSPFAEVQRTSGISGTRNCDWWFFEQAILLDTAGRYAIPVDEGRDRDEWQSFLGLLAKFRKKEPINGLVVTIAADKLASTGPEELEEDGRSIRSRIDELMRVLGAKFPIYVLVTKCDLIQGMTSFCEGLPEAAHSQAMGQINETLERDVAGFIDRTIRSIRDRLQDLRLLLFHKPHKQKIDPGLLLFPEEFGRLKPGLSAFMKGAFQENPYQETPLLRGLYYSSGKQEGSPYSHFLKELGLIEDHEVLPGTNKGLFLHDFFSRILPADRSLFVPTQRTLEWSRLTQNLGLTAWLAVGIALCGLLSVAFLKNLTILRDVSKELTKPIVLQTELVSNVIEMDRFRTAILKVETRNRNWWVPRFGLTSSIKVEEGLKSRYVAQFGEGFLSPFDTRMTKAMAGYSGATPGPVLGSHVAHLARRINLLRARLENESSETLRNGRMPSYSGSLAGNLQEIIPEIGRKLTTQYLDYVIWQNDEKALTQELNNLQTWLKHLLTLKGANLNWVTDWINGSGELAPITLQEFWGGTQPPAMGVAPAFTLAGKAEVDSFLKEVEAALYDPLIIAGAKADFQQWYREAYFKAWGDFCATFEEGTTGLITREAWRQVASQIVSGENPYFNLLNRTAAELAPFDDADQKPAWVNFIDRFQRLQQDARKLEASKAKQVGILKKTTKKVKSKLAKIEKKTGLQVRKDSDLESAMKAAQALRDYQQALTDMAPVTASQEAAFELASIVYGEDPATSQEVFFAGRGAIDQLKTAVGIGDTAPEFLWRLVEGPLDYVQRYAAQEAACQIQTLWEKQVLLETQGVTDRSTLIDMLLGQDGYAIKFVKGPAAPFVERSLKKGFQARARFGHQVPIRDEFLTFLTKGAKAARPVKSKYTVTIRGEPTSANTEATVIPHSTVLEMECADEKLRLVNLNYPVRKSFGWSSQNCGDVVFRIKIGNLNLSKRYRGHLAFAKFLRDFQKGKRVFYPGDFPDAAADLKRLGVRTITARYQFQGHRPVLRLLQTGPGNVPEEIVTCWDQ